MEQPLFGETVRLLASQTLNRRGMPALPVPPVQRHIWHAISRTYNFCARFPPSRLSHRIRAEWLDATARRVMKGPQCKQKRRRKHDQSEGPPTRKGESSAESQKTGSQGRRTCPKNPAGAVRPRRRFHKRPAHESQCQEFRRRAAGGGAVEIGRIVPIFFTKSAVGYRRTGHHHGVNARCFRQLACSINRPFLYGPRLDRRTKSVVSVWEQITVQNFDGFEPISKKLYPACVVCQPALG